MKLTGDELEFALSQYHDGTLNPVGRAAIEETLASDSNARAMLAEFARLDALVKRTPGVPDLAWDKVQARFASAIEAAEAPAVATFKIGTWSRVVGGVVALAAAIAIVVSVTMRNDPPTSTSGASVIQVSVGPGASTAVTDVARAEINVGPSPQMALSGWEYESAFLERPSRVVIAVSPEPAQDGGSTVGPF